MRPLLRILSPEPCHIPSQDVLTAFDLSATTFRRIRLNYCWAFGYNTLMIPLAAGVLYAPLRFQLPPWAAGEGLRALQAAAVQF